jgi:hypothetical protein
MLRIPPEKIKKEYQFPPKKAMGPGIYSFSNDILSLTGTKGMVRLKFSRSSENDLQWPLINS